MPLTQEAVDKVTAFVTRGEGAAREVLVFRHPDACVQFPAGTVEPGEAISAAVIREVAEETGLTAVAIVGRLATLPEPTMSPDHCMITRGPISLRAAPDEKATAVNVPLGHRMGRGVTVRRMRNAGGYVVEAGYAQVGYEEFDIRGPHDWVLQEVFVGWLPLDAITTEVRRHLFHLRPTAPTPDRWTCDGDVPGCRLYWTPLSGDPGLMPWHDRWLADVREQLR